MMAQPSLPEVARSVRAESRALTRILRGGHPSATTVEEFFESIWQNQCALFRASPTTTPPPSGTSTTPLDSSDDPYSLLIRNGWQVLIQLLEAAGDEDERLKNHKSDAEPHSACRRNAREGAEDDDDDYDGVLESCRPILFRDQSPVPPDQSAAHYRNNLLAAYLDGCSVVVNHSDCLVREIAALCDDLQHSFPHAYGNAYLTPPGSQAVRAHADDRDVLVVQVVGEKHWTVYQGIPVPFPYPEEQAGKSFPVPPEVYGRVLLDCVLRPGDVLYLPRGYVHEAKASDAQPSFHVTAALATHDWTLAGVMSQLTSSAWTRQVEFRRAVHRDVGRVPVDMWGASTRERLEIDVCRAIRLLHDELSVERISEALRDKYQYHNRRAAAHRRRARKASASDSDRKPSSAARPVPVSLETPIRCATPEEKAKAAAAMEAVGAVPGLHVRDAIHGPILRLLQAYRDDPHRVSSVRDAARRLGLGSGDDGVCDLALLAFARLCVEQGALFLAAEP